MKTPDYYLYEEDLKRTKAICEESEKDNSGFVANLVFLNNLLKRIDRAREKKKDNENDLLPFIWVMVNTSAQALKKLSKNDPRVTKTSYNRLNFVARELGKVITK